MLFTCDTAVAQVAGPSLTCQYSPVPCTRRVDSTSPGRSVAVVRFQAPSREVGRFSQTQEGHLPQQMSGRALLLLSSAAMLCSPTSATPASFLCAPAPSRGVIVLHRRHMTSSRLPALPGRRSPAASVRMNAAGHASHG